MNRQLSALYVSYTGLLEPLGQSQVLPYVRGLATSGRAMIVLSFEKPTATSEDCDLLRANLEQEGIRWVALRYHARPRVLSTLLDVMLGVLRALKLGTRGLTLIHARAHVPGAIALLATPLLRIPFLFDHRGLMADEYADAGIWRRGGFLYRWTTRTEALLLRRANAIVVLTERLAEEIKAVRPVTVIPCAVDLGRYRPASSEPEYDLVYAGSWGGLYLAEEMLRFFLAFKALRPGARLLVLTATPTRRERVEGIDFRSAAPSEVPELLVKARVGMSLRRRGRAQVAAAPVKVSEYWACGLPIVTSPGVGDLDALVQQHRTGVVLGGFSDDDVARGARELVKLLAEGAPLSRRCRLLAEERFDLNRAVAIYDGIYSGLERAT